MKHYIKVGGWHVCLDDFKEENWSDRTRKIASWLAVAALFTIFYVLIAVR
jgi:hypothetical protein